MIVSHLWVEACLKDKRNIGKAEKWEVTDEELGGANGPWLARKRREEGRERLLTGFEVMIDGNLEGLDNTNMEDLLSRAGARVVPDKNAFSYGSPSVTKLVMVDSTAKAGLKVVQKWLRIFKLATVDKDWLIDTISGNVVRPIMQYTLSSIQREQLQRAGYKDAVIGDSG